MYFCLEKTYVLGGILTVDCRIASNSFILGGGTHSRFRNAGKMQFSSFAV